MVGAIQAIEVSTVKNGPAAGKPMWRVTVGGVKYATFDNPGASEGDVVEFYAYKDKTGKYDNAKDFRKAGTAGPASTGASWPQAVPSPGPSPVPSGNGSADPSREARIVRQNATSSAVALIAALVQAKPAEWDVESAFAAVSSLSPRLFDINYNGYSDKEVGF